VGEGQVKKKRINKKNQKPKKKKRQKINGTHTNKKIQEEQVGKTNPLDMGGEEPDYHTFNMAAGSGGHNWEPRLEPRSANSRCPVREQIEYWTKGTTAGVKGKDPRTDTNTSRNQEKQVVPLKSSQGRQGRTFRLKGGTTGEDH